MIYLGDDHGKQKGGWEGEGRKANEVASGGPSPTRYPLRSCVEHALWLSHCRTSWLSLLFSIGWDHPRAVNSPTLTSCGYYSCLWLGCLLWPQQSKEMLPCGWCVTLPVCMELCTAGWNGEGNIAQHHCIYQSPCTHVTPLLPLPSSQSTNMTAGALVAANMKEDCILRRTDWKSTRSLDSWCYHRANNALNSITLSLLH